MLLIFSRRTAAVAAQRISRRLPFATVRDAGHRVLESIRKYSAYPRQLVNVLVCSIAVQVLRIVQAYCLGRGLGIEAPLTIYFAFIPLILLVMLLPVTFNGIGTSQAAFVWFFAQAGVDAAPAFALSVLFVALGIVGNLPGGILYAIGHTPAAMPIACDHDSAAGRRHAGAILKGLGFVVYNLVAATILLETIIVVMLHAPRVVGASPRPVRRLIQQVYRHFNRALIQFDPQCARYDPGLAYTLKPGTCTFENIEFKNSYRINRAGVRDEEASLDGAGSDRARRLARDGLGRRAGGSASSTAGAQERAQGAERGGVVLRHRA